MILVLRIQPKQLALPAPGSAATTGSSAASATANGPRVDPTIPTSTARAEMALAWLLTVIVPMHEAVEGTAMMRLTMREQGGGPAPATSSSSAAA